MDAVEIQGVWLGSPGAAVSPAAGDSIRFHIADDAEFDGVVSQLALGAELASDNGEF